VRDEHDGDADAAQDLGQVGAHARAQERVDVAPGLVHEHEGRLGRERARQGDALLLAARELVRIALAQSAQPDEAERLGDAFAPAPAVDAEADVLGHGQVREERIVLEDHADAATLGRHPGAVAGDGRVLEPDLAGVRVLEAGDQAQQRRLAAAARAEERDDLALLDAEVGGVHGLHRAEALGHAVYADHPASHVRVTLQEARAPAS
jgi:hypothetical protein